MISRPRRSDAEGAVGTWTTAPDAELNRLTDLIIGAAIEVHRHTGPGLGVKLDCNFNEPILKKGIKRMVNHFGDPRPAEVPSAPSARQPNQAGLPSTDENLLKTPRLHVSAVNTNPRAVK
jgi:hypothetical protein